jgi:signal transduction histidine kinase/ActR/RegA family two-component response regulator
VKRVGIRLRILLAMMAVIVGFVALTSWIVGGLVDRFLQAEIESSLERGTQACARFTELRDAVLLDQARSVAQAPHLRAALGTPDVDRRTIEYTLSDLARAVEAPLLFVGDARGRLLADMRTGVDALPSLEGSEGIERALRGEESCGLLNYGGEAHLVAICPVTLDSTVLGFLGIGCQLEQRVADLRRVTGFDVAVMRADELLASSWREGAPDHVRGPWKEFSQRTPARLISDRREFMAISLPTGSAERLVLSRPLDQVLSYFKRARVEILLCGLMIGLLALLVSRSIAARIARPIRELTGAANALARGNLSAQVQVDAEDEFGVLSRAFNDMARQIDQSMVSAMQKARAAEQANAAKSVFLATMSHELRTPLNAVLGLSEELAASKLTDQQRDHLQLVQGAGQDLLAIIDDVLAFAKLDGGELELESVEFNLRACLARALSSVQPILAAKGLSAAIEVAGDVPETVTGPRDRVRQIVRNFVDNAAKFSARGQVLVRASLVSESQEGVVVRVEVEDQGIGIAADRLDSLFKPFTQLDAGANRKYGGAGLGLAICKELAEAMGGHVGVTSTVDRGSTFWFTARLSKPLREAQAASRSEPTAALPTRSLDATPQPAPNVARAAELESRKAQRILVAEDNPVNQRVTGAMLTRAGWTVGFAENGQRAIELLSEGPFDLILMDCQMPVMDGLEATRAIRAAEFGTERHVPIVALTANAFEADREACFAAGMDGFLAKPVRSVDLTAELERWLSPMAER